MFCEDVRVLLDFRKLWLKGMKGLVIDGVCVSIITTPLHFGGSRRWFLCPKCERRCLIIYEGFSCQRCLGLPHLKEHLSVVDRMILKSRALRRELGQMPPNPLLPAPEKPSRMRQARYDKITTEIYRLELKTVTLLDQRMRRKARGAKRHSGDE